MFKKTLIAAALATTALGAAASTVTITAESVGVEYAAGAQTIDANTATVTLGRNYASGDIITVTVAGASLVTSVGSPATAVTPTIGGTAAAAVEFLDYSGNTVRVLVNNTVTTGQTITVAGLKLNVASAVDKGKVTVSAAGRVDTVDGPINVDAAKAVDYITFATEYSAKVSDAFNAVVDVNKARKEFSTTTGGADAKNADTLVIANTEVNPAAGNTTASSVTYTVKGDFSFLDVDGDGTLEAKEGTLTSTAGTVVPAKDFQSLTITDATAATVGGTVGVTVTTPADVVIPDQTFTANVVVGYSWNGATFGDTSATAAAAGGVTKTTVDNASAGAWTLNGAKAHIPFLPFGSAYSQSVTVSNTSTQAGGVDLVIYSGGTKVEVEGIATVGANGVTDLSSAIRDAVANAGLSGNLSMDVIINAPDASITVEALYYAKADADRLRTL